jgi:hypothetical protein
VKYRECDVIHKTNAIHWTSALLWFVWTCDKELYLMRIRIFVVLKCNKFS